jgi:hypothetical protein
MYSIIIVFVFYIKNFLLLPIKVEVKKEICKKSINHTRCLLVLDGTKVIYYLNNDNQIDK